MKLDTVRRHALSLPDATEAPHHDHGSFRVGGRIFVTVPPAGDAIHAFVDEVTRERALAMYPDWTEKLLRGGKVVGLRIALAKADAAAVKALVSRAHAARAARRR